MTSTSSKKRLTTGTSSSAAATAASRSCPVRRVARCLERVGEGSLCVVLEQRSSDQLGVGALARDAPTGHRPRARAARSFGSSDVRNRARSATPAMSGCGRLARGAHELDRHVEQPLQPLLDELPYVGRRGARAGRGRRPRQRADRGRSPRAAGRRGRASRSAGGRGERHRERVDPVRSREHAARLRRRERGIGARRAGSARRSRRRRRPGGRRAARTRRRSRPRDR